MKQRIQKAQQDLTSQFNNTTKIMPLCADIKNMYTELPHKEILKSIKFMLRRSNKNKKEARHTRKEKERRNTFRKNKRGYIYNTRDLIL